MTNSLRSKLILSYLGIATLTALLIYGLIRFTSNQRLETLVLEQELSEFQDEVLRWYEAEGTWDGFRQYFLALHPPPPRNGNNREDGPRSDNNRGNHGVIDSERRLLNVYLNLKPGDIVSAAFLEDALPIIVDEATVGWILPDDDTGISLKAEERVFLQSTNQVLLIASAIAITVAIALGFGLANMLLRPIVALTRASELMAQGQLKQEIWVDAPDEIGQLAKSFTNMSKEVALANQRRKQLTADIAHDLSTPLHIASGYIETMIEGDLAATPERLSIVAFELGHLRRLIEDLDLLALTDNNKLSLQFEPVTVPDLMEQVVTSFQPLAVAQNIDLKLIVPESVPANISADRARLIQVLGNILNNALQFTPTGGNITTSVKHVGQKVHIEIKDSGIGMTAEELPFVFDRLYQGDASRGQAGKLGLGLAISKGLIEAMGGTISATSKGHGHGTTFSISLPS